MLSIGSKEGIAKATKNFEEGIIRLSAKQLRERRGIVENFGG